MWIDEIRSRVRENRRLQDSDITESIQQAFNEYSGYYQHIVSEDYVTTSSSEYTLPTNWKTNFSYIISLEYPTAEVLAADNPTNLPIPAYRETSEYSVVTTSTTSSLYLFFDIDEGETYRLKYVIPYSSESVSDVPTNHVGALMNLATSYVLVKLAAIFAQSSDYSLEAETVDYKSHSKQYLEQAEWYRKRWEQVAGLSADGTAEGFVDPSQSGSYCTTKTIEREGKHSYRMFRPSYERTAYNTSRT